MRRRGSQTDYRLELISSLLSVSLLLILQLRPVAEKLSTGGRERERESYYLRRERERGGGERGGGEGGGGGIKERERDKYIEGNVVARALPSRSLLFPPTHKKQ